MRQGIALGDLKRVEAAIEGGEDINGVDRHSMTPLMYAARWGRGEITRLLLEHGAGVRQSVDADAVLTLARRFGHADVSAILREADATE